MKDIKVAAAEEDITASVLLERIAKEFLDRRKSARSRNGMTSPSKCPIVT